VSFFSVWHYSKYTGGTYLACHGKIILNLVWSTGKYHVGHTVSGKNVNGCSCFVVPWESPLQTGLFKVSDVGV